MWDSIIVQALRYMVYGPPYYENISYNTRVSLQYLIPTFLIMLLVSRKTSGLYRGYGILQVIRGVSRKRMILLLYARLVGQVLKYLGLYYLGIVIFTYVLYIGGNNILPEELGEGVLQTDGSVFGGNLIMAAFMYITVYVVIALALSFAEHFVSDKTAYVILITVVFVMMELDNLIVVTGLPKWLHYILIYNFAYGLRNGIYSEGSVVTEMMVLSVTVLVIVAGSVRLYGKKDLV